MAIFFVQLRFGEPSSEARRLLWHVVSIGTLWRDEPKRHERLDKASRFLLHVAAGNGQFGILPQSDRLERGQGL